MGADEQDKRREATTKNQIGMSPVLKHYGAGSAGVRRDEQG